MKYEKSSKDALKLKIWRTSSLFCVLITAGLLSSCASVQSRQAPNTPAHQDTRSELVFLNIEESSGWVAYNCNQGDAEELENYRVVVIRQKTGEIIYDSQIPLAANLCTHGFEMAPNDPRLKKIAQNVDDGIIEPLEAYQRSLEQEDMESEVGEAPVVKEPMVEETVAPAPKPTSAPTSAPTTEPSVKRSTNPTPSKPIIEIVGSDEKQVELRLTKEASLKIGDRLFLREPPTYIRIPGTGEDILNSEGEVTGLIEISAVEGLSAQATVLSGEVPKDGIAEKIQNP